jgi:dTDP-4-amino-4,6-dideoxygalactose transaminase
VPPARVDFSAEDRAWIAAELERALASGQLTLGAHGAEFERAFAGLCGRAHGVAVASGTAALEIAFRALGVAGKDVLVPTNTFFATAAALIHAGGRPVLVDADPDSLGISVEDAERRLTANTVGAVAVHIGGIVGASTRELAELCRRRGLWLVEDAAHAHGSTLSGVAAGGFGAIGTFSFYPTKVMTAGEGGMLVCDDPRLAEEARLYRDQGKTSFHENSHSRLGYNWRLSEPHAIIGRRQLARLPEMIASRQRTAAFYAAALKGHAQLRALEPPAAGTCNYYKYVVVPRARVDRNALKAFLRERFEVGLAGEVYAQPLHRQPVFAALAEGTYPVAEDLCARHLCLPIYSGMSEDEAAHAVGALSSAFERGVP